MLLIGALGLLPQSVSAGGWPVYIDITAQGSDNSSPPGLPVNFDATLITNFHSTCNWTAGMDADGYLIYAKFSSAPAFVGDGYLVDNTTILGCDDFSIDLSMTDEELWYSLWTYNSIGISVGHVSDYVQGGVAMSLALSNLGSIFLFLGIIGLGAFLILFSWWSRIGAVAVTAAVLWFIMGCYCVATGVISGYTLNTILGIILVLIAFIAAILPVLWRRPQLTEEDDGYTSIGEERDRGGEQPDREMRQRARIDDQHLSDKQLDREYNDIKNKARKRREAYQDD